MKRVELATRQFQLILEPEAELKCHVTHLPNGVLLADGYSYAFGQPFFDDIRHTNDTVVLSGRTETGIAIEHRFTASSSSDWIEEEIALTNLGPAPLDLQAVRCGFTLSIPPSRGQLQPKLGKQTFAAIPFLREPLGSKEQYSDYSLTQILTEQFRTTLWSPLFSVDPVVVSAKYAAEGWFWRCGEAGFLITKYSQSGMEWSILDHVPLSQGGAALRWGGLGIHRGHPEHGAWLLPGRSHRFGVTRLTAIKGGRNEAFYAFRAEMAARGHGCPSGFNPPVHWNELYDNKLLSGPDDKQDDPERRKKYYTLADMKEEAAKAQAFGCEALYLDPGWDTNFASNVWDDSRLGSFRSFASTLASDFGLKCSLHTPLSGWCNPSTYPPECYLLDRFGKRAAWQWFVTVDFLKHFGSPICGASKQYLDEAAKRLKALARDGAACFIFDGTQYHGECWDENHGHAVPARIEEHVDATSRLARMVHEQFPEVLIEMHDHVIGGTISRYVPIYYGHGRGCGAVQDKTAGFDTVWAFELMWNPMEDLLSGKAIALYYYNLAYSLPLYIHIDLRTDNEHALAFWWNASTCRHLGIGGTHADQAVVEAQKRAMRTYKRLKSYFASGIFYGIDETTHVHASADGESAVMNCFNLTSRPVEREIRIEPAHVGLVSAEAYDFRGARFEKTEDAYVATVSIPALGHVLIEILQADSARP